MKIIAFAYLFILSVSGCSYFDSGFEPNERVFTLNYFEYSNPEIARDVFGVSARKVVTCCNSVTSKSLFDSYFLKKIEIAKKTIIPSGLSQFKSENSFLYVPHADAPVEVLDGGTYVTNEEVQCLNFLRSLLKSGFVRVEEIGADCSSKSKL